MQDYISVAEAAQAWGLSERSVRNYCAQGRVPGAFLVGKTWSIPAQAGKPARAQRKDKRPQGLLGTLREEKAARRSGGLYHRLQVELTYNSNRIEGSRLSEEQTRLIFETATIGVGQGAVRVDDVLETVNHFRCIDRVIDTANAALTQAYIKRLHLMLKTGTQDALKSWFAVGEYKKMPNEVGGRQTTAPEEVAPSMEELLRSYEGKESIGLRDVLDFHWRFERIHPFQDGNGRVGRLVMLKECLRHGIVPFVITDDLKGYYYRGLQEYAREPGFLEGTALAAQDRFKAELDYFRIPYDDETIGCGGGAS